MKHIGTRIAQLRIARGWTQRDLAEQLHCTRQTVWHYEQGKRIPPVENLCAIADLFSVSLDYLCGRKPSGKVLLAAKKPGINRAKRNHS